MTDEEMIGTGRLNKTGGSATITMPAEVLSRWDVDENGKDIVWFDDGMRLYAVPQEQVWVSE